MITIKKAFLACVALLVTLITLDATGFIGNSLLGEKYCIVACGRGPLGVAPLGDVVQGVNEMAFGPTLEAFEQKGKNIVDYASKKADEKLLVLDENIGRKIDQIAEISQDSISQLDNVLASNINVGLEGLSRTVESLDIVGSKKNDELNSMLRGIVLLVVLSVMVVWLAKYIASKSGGFLSRLKLARWRVLAAAITVLIVAVAPNFIPLLKYRIPRIQSDLELEYRTEFNSLSFQRSAYIADQLKTIDPRNIEYLRKRDISSVLRDAYFNPASYRTTDGLAEINIRINSLLVPETDFSSAEAGKAVSLLDEPELEITLAMITWQVRQDMLARMQAANICAHVIQRQLSKSNIKTSPLLPLAAHYLASYLIAPVDEDELKIIKGEDKTLVPDIYEVNYPLKTAREMSEILGGYQKRLASAQSKEADRYGGIATLSRQIAFGKLMADTYKVAIPEYIAMLEANYQVSAAPPESKESFRAARKAHAQRIMKSWKELLSQSASDKISADTNLRLSMITALSATYERAGQYLEVESNGAVIPVLSKSQFEALPLDSSFSKQWIKNMNGMVRPSGFPLLGIRTEAQFLLDQKSLYDFELSYLSFLSEKSNIEKAKVAALNASKLGLFVCASGNQNKEGAAILSSCDSPDAQGVRIIWHIRSMIPDDRRTVLQSWREPLLQSLQRSPPII